MLHRINLVKYISYDNNVGYIEYLVLFDDK